MEVVIQASIIIRGSSYSVSCSHSDPITAASEIKKAIAELEDNTVIRH